jgi:ribonucleoside-triphosphate reductase
MHEKHVESLHQMAENIIQVQDVDLARENANLNGESFSGKMSKMGSEFSKWYAKSVMMPSKLVNAIDENFVYVHDLDQYVLGTTNCIFIPFGKLLERGFNTGNGSVRPPNSIMTAMSLVAIIFQSQQNSQYGGVSGNKIDWDLAPYVDKSFAKHFLVGLEFLEETLPHPFTIENKADLTFDNAMLRAVCPKAFSYAEKLTINETNQAAESMIHNLNTMSSRAGGQIPFTSINYGTCTSPQGRLVIRAILRATMNGLGNGETPIFPQHIFKCKKGVNQSTEDPNYDLFLEAIECSSKRLYPNFANIDAPFNLQYYNPEDPDTEFATMGCRTRVISDRFGYNHLSGKGNLSFNTLNLVKLGLEYGIALGERSEADLESFYYELYHYMDLSLEGLIHRFEIQAEQQAKASDFMMREGVWENGEKLEPEDKVREHIKHGSLSIGFIGVAECMKALFGKHHGEDPEVMKFAVDLIDTIRQYCDRKSDEHNLNITLFATPAEGLSGKFTKSDRQYYGNIEGVTDREYYTNSFHIPVYYDMKAADKIRAEAPFHELCNAGAISYIELDGNARNNQLAFLKIVQYALSQNISYFSVNHPVDRCPSCGYEGSIGDTCPNCAADESTHPFRRLRRVTGYLTGDYTTRFNSAKQAEVRDRVKHL